MVAAAGRARKISGFVMASQDLQGLRDACDRAMAAWREPSRWQQIQRNGMSRAFGWEESAARYLAVYQRAIERASHTA